MQIVNRGTLRSSSSFVITLKLINKTIPYLFIHITSILIHNLSWQGMFWRCLQNPNIDVMFVLIGY